MISKKDFCLSVLGDYCRDNNKEIEDLGSGDILESSNVAVAMEYLGMIETQDMKSYAGSRNGLCAKYLNVKEKYFAQLTMREAIDLLPEKADYYESW